MLLQLPVTSSRIYYTDGSTVETLGANPPTSPVLTDMQGIVYYHADGKKTLHHGVDDYPWQDDPGATVTFQSGASLSDEVWDTLRQRMLTDPEP